MNDRPFFILFFNIRKNLPSYPTFYFIYFSLKFNGLILATQNLKDYESKNNKILSIYSVLSKFLLFHSSFIFVSKYYQLICILIFIFSILLIIYFLFIFFSLNKIYSHLKNKEDFNLIKYYDNTKNMKLELKILTYIFLIISILNQHLFEYLFFGIIIPFINEDNSNLNPDQYLTNFFIDQLYYNKYIIMICNIVSFLICFFSDYIIIFLNDTKGFLSKYAIDIYSNKQIKIISLFLTLFQPFIGFCYIFIGTKKENFRIIICIVAVLLSLIYLVLSFKKFNYYFDSKIPQFILILVSFSCYGGIFELILLFYINEKNQMTQIYSVTKLIIIFITSIFIFYLIKIYNKNCFSKQLINNLFKTEEKKIDISEIYLYIKYYCMFRMDSSNFELFNIFYNHKKKCHTKNCFCELIKKRINIKKINNSLKKDEYSIIGEQEIVNRINYLFKLNIFTKIIEDYIVLHCQYIYAMRKREYYALYLCSMYLNCELRLSTLTRYFLFEIKKEILFKIQSNTNFKKKNLLVGNQINFQKNLFYEIIKLKYIRNFIIFTENIKYLVRNIFKNLETILSFRKQVNNNSKLGRMNEKSFSNFLSICRKIKKTDENIIKTIINYSKYRKNIIKNNEISYILTNYLILIHKNIPKKIENKFLLNYNFYKISNQLYKDFSEFNMNYPIIVSQNKSDNFVVSYMHFLLSNYLDYTDDEIKDKNINELLPSIIRKEHNLIVKQFSFLQNQKFTTSHTYILSKGNHLVNISLHSRILPNLYYFPNLIINIRIIQNEKNLSLSYHIFLDKNGYFINTCKEFENNFFFDLKKIKQLSITFNDFFGITSLEKKINNKQIDYFEENKAYTIFNSIPNKKMFYLRKKKKNVEQLKRKKYHFRTYINNQNLLIGINNINHILDEKGLDNEWYNITKCLYQRFQNSEDNSPIIKNRRRQKTKIINSSNKEKNTDDGNIFVIDYYLKEMGNKKYYMIKMIENTDVIQLKKSTHNLKKMLIKQKNPLMQKTKVQLTSKRSEVSQISSSQVSTHTNVFLLQSTVNDDYVNENNIKNISQFNELLNENSNYISNNNNNNSNNNSSLMNNSKIPLGDDSKVGFSELNLIQNLVNNQISRINHLKTQNKNKISNSSLRKNSSLINNDDDIKKSNIFRIKLIQHYTFFLFTSFGTVITLSIILLILKLKKIYEHKDLFQFNIYMEVLKSDTYLSILYSFTLCFQVSFNSFPYDTRSFIGPKKQSLQDNLAKFNSYIDKIKTNNKLKILYDYLYGKYNFTEIEKNWKISIRQSTILEEIKLILFNLNQIYNIENNTCNFINSFFAKNYESLNENDIPPSVLESVTFFGLQNTLQIFKIIFEKITSYTSNILFDYYKSNFNFITIFGILIIFFTEICYLIILEKINDDKNEIKSLLKYLFITKGNYENQLKFEIQIYCFKNMCEKFNETNIERFEKSKNELMDILIKKIKKKQNKTIKNIKNTSFINNEKLSQKNNNNDSNENYYNIEKNIYLPKSVPISYIILTFFLLLISLIVIISIIYANYMKNTFIFSVVMAMNFLERIPKCFELVYYAIISFTLVDVSLIGKYNSNYSKSLIDEYLNYYQVEEVFENNSQIYKMKESYYPILYIGGKMVENNIRLFLGKKTSILGWIKRTEKEFNYIDNLCYAASIYSLNEHLNYKFSYIEYFLEISEKMRLCYKYNFGCNKYGLFIEINYIYQEITNLFNDFILSENRTKTSLNVFFSSDITRINLDLDYVLDYVFKSYSFFVMKDIDNLYLKNIRFEIFFSSLILITLFFVVIYVYLLIGKDNYEYKNLLEFFSKMY